MVENFVTLFTRVGFFPGMNFLMDRELLVCVERLPALLTFVGLLSVCLLVRREGRLLAEGLPTLTAVVALMLGGSFPAFCELSFPKREVPNPLRGLPTLFRRCAFPG